MSTLAANSHIICREAGYSLRDQQQQLLWGNGSSCCLLLRRNSVWFHPRNESFRKISNRDFRAEAFWPDMTRPTSIQMEPITDSDHLDQILLQAKDLPHLIIIDWMAAWCRKCIYLKPKLEKLAADFDPKVKFYCVDVNKVPQSLVKRGNISKMPTIQLWKDGEMKAE